MLTGLLNFLEKKNVRNFSSLAILLLGLGFSSLTLAQVSGTVFKDFNANGTMGGGEVGLAGVTVSATNVAGTALTVSYSGAGTATNSTGGYSVAGGTLGQIRLVFTMPDNYVFASTGATGGTTVLFPTSATQDLAVNYPNDYCQPTPNAAVACYENGQSGGNTNPAVVQQIYSASGVPPSQGGTSTVDPQQVLSIADIGSVWGEAYQREKKLLYLSALTKRHVGFGTQNEGGIYIADMSGSGALLGSYTLQGVTPANGGAAIDLGTVTRTGGADYTLSDRTTPSVDLDAFDKVGKTSYGDAEISADGKTLWLTNLNQIGIISVDISGANPLVHGAVNQYLVSSPPTCTNGVFRIYGLKEYHGKLYVGGVCTGETGGTASDLKAYVLSYNISNMAAGYTVELSFPLNYARESVGGGGPQEWQPWVNAWRLEFDSQSQHWGQALLSNIEFTENGSMVLGFLDRFGNMVGFQNYPAIAGYSGNAYEEFIADGDIIHVCNNNGTWALEGSAGCPVNDLGPFPNQSHTDGPSGNGEFYWNDNYINPNRATGTLAHEEVASGALALLMGTGQVISTTYDPIGGFWTHGFQTYNTTNGNFVSGYQIVGYNDFAFGKANGLGDVELLCNPAPIEIGNRVWSDTNNNGIQDAGESPLSGITVTLCLASAPSTPVATATTDANGNYYFSSATGTNSASAIYGLNLQFSSNYILKFPTTATGGLSISTKPNTGSDLTDSDASTAGQIAFTTGTSGQNNHSFDVGYAIATTTVCTKPNAGADAAFCLPKTTGDLTDAPTGTQWIADPSNTTTATIDATTGAITGMTATGTYKFILQTIGDATCADTMQIVVSAATAPYVLCNNGTTSYTISAPATYTNVVWFNMAGVQVGTGTNLIVSSATNGLADGSESYYYTALDATGCVISLCCPVNFTTMVCCTTPNCVTATVKKN